MKMQIVLLIASLLPFLSTIISMKLNPKFIVQFFGEKNIRIMLVFACWQEPDVLEYMKQIMGANSRMSYYNIQDYTDIANIFKVDYNKLGVVLDMDCPNSDLILNQFSAAKLLFNESYIWLTITRHSVVPTVDLRKLPLRLDSELVVALINDEDTYLLYDVYNPSFRHGGKLNVTDMGFWKKDGGLINYLTQYKYKRRQNLHGLMLNFSTILTNKPEPDLETYLTTQKNPHLDSMSRYHYALVLYLRDIYNFTINLKLDTTWGYRMPNGTIDGIVGDIIKGTVDASACMFQQRAERLGYVEYTVPTHGIQPNMFFRHPKIDSLRNQFLKPLETNVWWLALNISIVCWIFLFIAVKVEDYYRTNGDELLYSDAPSSTTITVVAAVSQQGSSIEPHLFSGRIAFLTLFIWSLMMFQFYSASIVGSLLAPPKRFINTLWDLADSDLEVGYEDIPYMRFHLATKDDPATLYFHKKKFRSGQKRKLWDDGKSGMAEVSKGGYAFSGETGTAYQIIEDTFTQEQICDVVEVPLSYPQYVSLITAKHSPFKKMIIYGLRQMVQHGLVNHLIKVWTHRRPQCPESFRSQPSPIGLTEFSPALMLIMLGLITATVIMIVENFRAILSRRRSTREEEQLNSQAKSTVSSAISELDT